MKIYLNVCFQMYLLFIMSSVNYLGLDCLINGLGCAKILLNANSASSLGFVHDCIWPCPAQLGLITSLLNHCCYYLNPLAYS